MAHFAEVNLVLDGSDGLYAHPARVGAIDVLEGTAFGDAGLLQYYNVTFNPNRYRLTLRPTNQFPGGFPNSTRTDRPHDRPTEP